MESKWFDYAVCAVIGVTLVVVFVSVTFPLI